LEISSEGAFVDLAKLNESTPFLTFINEVFSEGYYFSELNYQSFCGILYDFRRFKSKNSKALLAKALINLPAEKRPLYERFKIKENTAYYEFGPAYIPGEGRKDTEVNITFDELIAAAWNKQICFGLNVDSIRQKIKGRFKGLSNIAQAAEPRNGNDARLEYIIKLEKDYSPVEDPRTGRLDLKRNKCTFPQITDNLQNKIVRKIQATHGTPGYHLNGKVIEPKAGHDIDLKTMAGEGTDVVVENGTEYLAANRIGYIVVDPKSGKICVTNEAQNHSPIGPETGNLEIKADHIIQYNEIQNGYSIKCNNITVEGGDVSGEIVSEKGLIEIKGNVSSGRLIAKKGNIDVKGLVTMNAYLESLHGSINLQTMENSTVVGKNISIASAVNCNIVGESVAIGTLQASKITGISVSVEKSAAGRKGESTDIIIPILDLTDKRIRVISHILAEKKARLPELESRLMALKENKVLLAFLEASKAEDGPTMNALRRHAVPIMNDLSKLTKEFDASREEVATIEENLGKLTAEQDRRKSNLQKTQHCIIEDTPKEVINLKLYGGLDWPADFDDIGPSEEATYRNFMSLVDSLTKGFSNYKRKGCVQPLTEPCRYDHLTLVKMCENDEIIDSTKAGEESGAVGTVKGAQRESRANVISEEDFKNFLKERKWLPRKQSIEITVDGIFKGYLNDFSTSEMSMFMEKNQKWRPVFEKGEKLKLIAQLWGDEMKYDVIIAFISDRHDYIKVGGYFINISNEDVDKLYKLKNRFEVLQKSSDRIGS
jgi:uncharacterized protein (DUF342 family)